MKNNLNSKIRSTQKISSLFHNKNNMHVIAVKLRQKMQDQLVQENMMQKTAIGVVTQKQKK